MKPEHIMPAFHMPIDRRRTLDATDAKLLAALALSLLLAALL